VDELSHCIDQLEAEISDGGVCSRSAMCNGEASDGRDSHIAGNVIGCIKCHKDNAYEQVTLITAQTTDAILDTVDYICFPYSMFAKYSTIVLLASHSQ